jgi:hypothetical protein
MLINIFHNLYIIKNEVISWVLVVLNIDF